LHPIEADEKDYNFTATPRDIFHYKPGISGPRMPVRAVPGPPMKTESDPLDE
jgi:hypothetical protein